MSKKTLSNLLNEITYIVFDMLCIDCKNAKYFKYMLISRAWATYFIPILWSNATREFDMYDTKSVKLWEQILKFSIYYDSDRNNENPPMFDYLEYIEELSLNPIDLYYYYLEYNFNSFEADNKSMIIRRNVIKKCNKLKYLDNRILWISNDIWKKDGLDILFTKIGPMTRVVFKDVTNIRIEKIISTELRVKSIKYENFFDEKTLDQLKIFRNFEELRGLGKLGKIGGLGKLTNNCFIDHEIEESKQKIVYQSHKELEEKIKSYDYFQQLDEVE
ncbi:4199_t:CDS:1 [Cetraspora pellucida]|uniref:4199_t:CDS:1 n=1 Tax=Cetraspora pellucida TaxID=1433469 RepID=A0ACA9QE27_9GLOM|nr:4199_t:CDS:1 [Cetraspora pellucida]